MKISLENWLKNKLDEVESMHDFNVGTETVRCWIEEHSEQLRQSNVVRQSEQLKCGNPNPPCAPNLKFGMLECCNCEWGE